MPQIGVVYFENSGRTSVMAQPKFANLDGRGLSLRNYEGTSKPSCPDYCAMTCGGYAMTVGFFGGNPSGKDGTFALPASGNANIFNQLQTAGFTWKAYEEGVTSAGYTHAWGDDLGTNHYATRHCPAAFYSTTYPVVGSGHGSGRYDHDELVFDITNHSLPDFFFISPNLQHQGHSPYTLTDANNWITNGAGAVSGFAGIDSLIAAMRADGILLVTFDNVPVVDTTAPVTGTGIVYAVIVGPNVTAAVNSTVLNHFGMLSAIQARFTQSKFTGAQVDANYTSATAVPLPATSGTDVTPPTTPTETLTVQGSASIQIALSGSTDAVGVTGYEISRSPAGAGTWTVIAPSAGTPYLDSGLTPSTGYDYRTRARDAAGNFSPYSTTQTATTGSSSSLATTPTAKTPGFYSSLFDFTTNVQAGRTHKAAVRNGVGYIVGESDHTVDHSGTAVDRTTTPYVCAVNQTTQAVIQTWLPAPNGIIHGCALTSTGKLVVWGDFTTICGVTRNRLAILNTLSSTSDTTAASVDASTPDLQITGGVVRHCIMQDASSRAWICGAFTSAGGATHNRVARLKLTTGVWGVDAAFTGAIASGVAKQLHAKSDGSKIVLAGDFPNALVALDGTTGVNATWNFTYPAETGAQHALWVVGDDTFVYFGGDFGPAVAICTDWTGSGPSTFSNVVTGSGNYSAYWYWECSTSTQTGLLVTINGAPYILIGHQGTSGMRNKNTPWVSTTAIPSFGIACFQQGNVTNDSATFMHPPDFGTDPNQGASLKLWGAYQDTLGNIHFLGDFTTANGSNAFYRYARYDATGVTPDTTAPSVPTGLTAGAQGNNEIDLAWVASADEVGGSGLAGYQLWRDDGSGGGFVSYKTLGIVTSYADIGLSPGTFYQYKVAAFDHAGNQSAFGTSKGATTGSSGSSPNLSDLFTRNVSNNWGTASDGHNVWTIMQGTPSQFSVVNGTGGELQLIAGNAPIIAAETIVQQDYDLTVTYKMTALPAGAQQTFCIGVRASDPTNYTRLTINQTPGGNALLGVDRQIANVNTSLGTFNTGAGQLANTLYKARIQAIGTAVRARVWLASAAEPSTWQIDGVDSVAAVISGSPIVRNQALAPWTGGGIYIVTDVEGAVPTGGGGGGGGSTVVADDSGNGLTGTLTAGTSGVLPTGVAGPHGTDRALHFDGTGGRIEVPDTIGSLNAIHWTLAAWVKLDSPPGDTDPIHQRYEILEKAGAYWINVRYDTTPPFLIRTGSFFGGVQAGFDFIDSAAPIVPGVWTHVAGTYDGVTLAVYIGGTLSASKAKTGDSGGGTTEPAVIGAKHRYGAPGELLEAFMHGSIANMIILDHAATVAEIAAMRDNTWPIWTPVSAPFTPVSGDVGKLLRARQVATNRAGADTAVGPPSTAIVSVAGQGPLNTTAPSLGSVSPVEGDLVNFSQGVWTGTPTPTIIDVIQIASSPNGPWSNAAPANQPYRIPTDGSAVGRFLSLLETGTNSSGNMSVRSAPSTAIQAASGPAPPPSNVILPALSPSSVAAGVPIHSSEGVWQNVPPGDAATYAFQGRANAGAAVTTVQADGPSSTYTPSVTDVQIRSVVTHRADANVIQAFSAWAQPLGDWTISPIFPQPGATVFTALVHTSWQLIGTLPAGTAFYARGDGGPWIQANNDGTGVLTADVTLVGPDGAHLIEGDVH